MQAISGSRRWDPSEKANCENEADNERSFFNYRPHYIIPSPCFIGLAEVEGDGTCSNLIDKL